MGFRAALLAGILIAVSSCFSGELQSLDPSIPRLETPVGQIAYIRTKWMNGRHTETVLYDRQDRPLEVFFFGRANVKVLYRYAGTSNPVTIYYYHDDSSSLGYITVDTLRRTFDGRGRVATETHRYTGVNSAGRVVTDSFRKRLLAYTATGDTVVVGTEGTHRETRPDSSQRANIDRWETDDQRRPSRHYRLCVVQGSRDPRPDTLYNFSERFAYDAAGRRTRAWFDSMYLGRFYIPQGPDTIWYTYDARNRLVAERHRYTTDMRNKREIDTTGFGPFNRESIELNRQKFFVGDSIFHNNDRVDRVRYRYDVFDPVRHLPLAIPAIY